MRGITIVGQLGKNNSEFCSENFCKFSAGTYSDAAATVCLMCPAGKACNDSQLPSDCVAGYYSLGGKVWILTITFIMLYLSEKYQKN